MLHAMNWLRTGLTAPTLLGSLAQASQVLCMVCVGCGFEKFEQSV